MSTNQISINNLSKAYDNGFEALKKVNLQIKKGECIGIHGRSGAGKTTLINLLLGLLTPLNLCFLIKLALLFSCAIIRPSNYVVEQFLFQIYDLY